ncbi:replicase [Grapevine virus G]|uniref:ORF1 protein n=1 Tax=Grapevine virus G TaxID=2022475 RepID=A0A2H4N946_9VIRU|nr:replicase [Grapevine virus G]ATV81248.1 replicase [Grapevine virus G]
MSLGAGSQRNAYANVISNLDAESSSKLKLLKGEEVLKIESDANNLYDYYVSDQVYDFLVSKGIPLSNQCFRVHSHPASKIIENYFLYNVISNHIVSNTIFISLKESKLVQLGVKKAHIKDNVNLINRLIHAKDALRYSDPVRNLDLSTLKPEFKEKLSSAKRVVIHDEVHYWSLLDFQNFLGLIDGPLIYSIIYPPEVHMGYESSLHPDLYEFRYIKDRTAFIWAPDGNYGASYTQPVNPWLLSTNKLHDSMGRTWTLTKLETIGSHHLFLCVQGSKIVEDQHIFTDFTLVDPKLFASYANRNPRLRASFVRRTAHYLMALKKADSASAVSKLRQLSKSDETADEILFVGGLAKCISDLKYFNNVSGLLDLGEVIKHSIEHMFFSGLALYMVDKQAYHMEKMRVDLKNLVTPTLVVACGFKEYKSLNSKHFMKIEDYIDSKFEGGLTGEFEPQYAMIPMFERDPYSRTFAEGEERLVIPKLERECARFKQMLGPPRVVEQKAKYFTERPADGEDHVYIETVPKFFIKVMLLEDGAPHILYQEGLIGVDEYIKRATYQKSQDEPVGVVEAVETTVDDEVPVEEQMDLGGTLEAVVEAKKNLCLLKPLSEHLKVEHPILVGHMISIDSSFARFLNEDGLGLPGLLMIAAAKNMTMAISRKGGGYLHIDGEYNPIGIEISSNHATLVPYERIRNLPSDMLRVSETCGTLSYTVKAERALRLVNAFKKGFTGVLLNEFVKQWGRVETRVVGDHELQVSSFLGFAGCGKTTFLLKMLKCNTGIIASVVSPRRNLADEWSKDLEGTSHNVYTFEKFLKVSASCDLLVVDECGLFPPGYLDLVFFMKEFKHIVILGDPLQCSYYNEKDNIVLRENSTLFKELRLPKVNQCLCGLSLDVKDYVGPSFCNLPGTGDKLKGRDAWFYSRNGEGYTYSGIKHNSRGWPESLDEVIRACCLEPQSFDHCLAQEYCAGGKIGFHADDEKCYPIGNPILTVQLDGACHFSVSCKKGASTFVLDGAKYFLMPNGMQATHKHAVEADKPRASLTFRSTRPVTLEQHSESTLKCPYMLFTNRLSRKNNVFGVKSHGTLGYEVKEINTLNHDLPTICFSRDYLEKKKEMKEIMTVSQSQGLSRKIIQLVLDTGSVSAEDTNVITALTRARNGIHVFFDVGKETVLSTARSSILKAFIKREIISKKMLMSLLSSETKIPFEFIEENHQIGSTRAEIEQKLEGDPGLKAMLTILDAEEMEEEFMEKELAPESSRTHLALSEFRNELFPTELKAKEDREAHIYGQGYSNQIRDDVPSERMAGPYGPSSIYLHHRSEDDITFILSIRKRLRFADYEKNCRSFALKAHIGEQIFDVFSRRIGLGHVPQVDPTESELQFTQKRIEKSAALLEAHSIRSDPDWPSNIIKIFIKNQCCTKMEKRGIDAKAGQTIACFAHSVLCRFGPLMRKTELQFRRMIPEHILIFSQKNYDDLDRWAKEYFLDFTGTDSDYEAFDRSQDATILGFERSFLRYFDWPEEMISEYVELKLRMGGTLGDLAIMRFSGEFGTFFFNTICNMAFTFLRYKIGPYQPLAFAGDDMVAPGKLEVDMAYHDLLGLLQLKAKVNYSDQPLFCGWRVSPFGIVKDPNLLLDRLEMKRSEGTLHLCIANYALEASYGYRLSDHLHFLNIDLDAYQELVRKIIKLKSHLPANISALYSSEEDIISDGEG